jgi:Bacteriophage head to tail connecting protein.
MAVTGGEIVKTLSAMKSTRQVIDAHRRECFLYTHPLRGIQFNQSVNTNPDSLVQQATAAQANIYDSTAGDATVMLASALVSGMTPANAKWAGMEVQGDDEGNRWLDKVTTHLHKNIHSSNFDAPIFEGNLDMAVSGMYALLTEPGEETEYHFELLDLANCYFASSKRGGLIDTMYMEFTLTAEQALKEYSLENLPERVKKAIDGNNLQQRFVFVQAIFPKRFDQGERAKRKDKLLPFASMHVEQSSKMVVREKGYHEFPVSVPRWLKLPNSVYAQGPVSVALPDIKTVNDAKKKVLDNADMAIAGMYKAKDDGVLNPKTVRIGPRRIIFMSDMDNFQPVAPAGKFDISQLVIADLQRAIRRTLFADMLESFTSDSTKTATEWHYRANMIRQLLGPTYGRLQSESLGPLLFRCFGISMRKWLNEGYPEDVGPMPESLKKKNVAIAYVSPLARAQKMEDVAAMDRYEEDLLRTTQAVQDTKLLDLYDWDAAKRKKAELLGVPGVLIFDVKTVEKRRKIREDAMVKAQQEAAQAKAAQQGQQGGGMEAMPMMGGMNAA